MTTKLNPVAIAVSDLGRRSACITFATTLPIFGRHALVESDGGQILGAYESKMGEHGLPLVFLDPKDIVADRIRSSGSVGSASRSSAGNDLNSRIML
jgi:hypothetical protein